MGRDRITANLPSADFDATVAFYGALGLEVRYRSDGWLILGGGSLELEFFSMPQLEASESWFSACIRVDDLDALHSAFAQAGLPSGTTSIPRMSPVAHEPHGIRVFYLVDHDGSLLRCIENEPEAS